MEKSFRTTPQSGSGAKRRGRFASILLAALLTAAGATSAAGPVADKCVGCAEERQIGRTADLHGKAARRVPDRECPACTASFAIDAPPLSAHPTTFLSAAGATSAAGPVADKQIAARGGEVAIDGLHLYIEEAVWLEDQMEHDPKGYAMPQAMMPDLPAHGAWRLNVALSLRNDGKALKRYDPADFTLVAGQGAALAPLDGQGGAVALGPGQRLNATFNFDFAGSGEEGEFYLRWRQGEEIVMLPLPQPQGARQTHRGGRPGNSKNGGGPAPPRDDHHRHDAGSAGKAEFDAATGIAPKAAGDERRND